MQKNYHLYWFRCERHRRHKIGLAMRLFVFLMTFGFAQVFAVGNYAQSQRINLELSGVTLKQVFSEIENETEFYFLYNGKLIDVNQTVDKVDVENKPIEEALDEILDGTEIEYKVINKQIVLSDATANKEKIQLKGKISGSDGAVIPGVAVLIKGSSIGTITDIVGNYSLEVPKGATLVFSFLGMSTQEIVFDGRKTLDVVMKDDAVGMEELLVVGYGTVKKKDVTGSMVNVSGDDIATRSTPTVEGALQGMVAGVTVSNNGGSPTEAPTIRIRGMSTLNSEGPLWIVDGVVNANGVDPNEIESITVLKDASAAIYGTRASGGVILVTTKKGQKGLNVDLNVRYGWNTPWKKLEALNAKEYVDFYTQAYQDAGKPVQGALVDPYFQTTRTDWLDAIMQTGTTQDYSLSISGGSEKSTFNIFTNWKDVEGTLINTYKNSGRIRIKSEHKFSDRLIFGQNLSVATGKGQGAETTDGYTGVLLGAIYYPPSAKIWSDKANGIYSGVVDPNDVDPSLAGQFGDLYNPYARLDRVSEYRPNINALVNAYAELEIIDGLKFKSNISYNYTQNFNKIFEYRIPELGRVVDQNRLITSASLNKSIVAEQLLTYIKEFGKHSINALAGYTSEEYTYLGFSASARDFDREYDWAQEFINANDYTDKPSSGFGDNSLVSALGRVAYSYDNKYYLTGVIRNDYTSKVMKDYRLGTFPSLSAAWRISDEKFFSDVNYVDDLKLRASWGKMGNINVLGNYEFDLPLSGANVYFNDAMNPQTGLYMRSISNSGLKWETTTTFDVGIDALLLNSRLNIVADYYKKNVSDMLIHPDLIDFAGAQNAPWVNIGEVQNKGYELLVAWSDKVGEVSYGVSANMAHNKNELLKYTDVNDSENHGIHMRHTLRPFRSEVGHSLYSYYLVKTDGIFQSDAEAQAYVDAQGNMIQPNAKAGDLKFVDYNNDGVINSEDKQFCGDYQPDFTYGFNFNLAYKNWDLSMMFQGVAGVDVFAGYKFTTYKPTQGYNLLVQAQDAWTPTNTGSDIPRATMVDENRNYSTESDWYLEDGSYLRLKNLTLGYNVPKQVVEKLGVSKARLFFTGQNLLTFTKYEGFDPEVGNYGMDIMKYPQARTVMFGANINF